MSLEPKLRSVGPYELRGKLGEGGMATVFRAWSPAHQREVALKLTHPGLASADESARLVREARVLAGLDHPFLITFLDAGEYRATPYLVMELVEGETLASRIARGGALDLEQALRLLRQLAEGTGELHRLGVIHRDLKPANVLLDRRNSPQIADLGLARGDAMSRLTQTGVLLGTPAYMAPEQINDGAVGPATDVYALGMILFELLTGRLPFQSRNALELFVAHVKQRPPRLSDHCPAAGPKLEALVACCLEKDPGDRYTDGNALAAALQELAQSPTRPARGAKTWAAVGLAAVSVLAGGAALWATLKHKDPTPDDPVTQAPTTPEGPDPTATKLAELIAAGERAFEHAGGSPEAIFAEAVELNPQSADALAGWARAALLDHRTETAHKRFVRALKINSRHPRSLVGMSLLYAERSDFTAAEDYLRQALEAESPSLTTRILAAQLRQVRGELSEARSALEALLRENPSERDVCRVLSGILIRQGELAQAERIAREGLEYGPDPQLEAQLLSILAGQRATTEVLREAVARACAKHPTDLGLLGVAVELMIAYKELPYASDLVEQLVAAHPLSPFPLLLRAQLRLSEGKDMHLALADLKRARAEGATPQNYSVALQLAHRLNRVDEGVRYAQRLTELRPKSPKAWRHLATLALAATNLPVALEALERHWELKPTTWAAVTGAFQCLSREDFTAAQRWLDRGALREPGHPQIRALSLGLRLQQGDASVIDDLVALTERPESGFEASFELARHYLKDGRTDEAYPHAIYLDRRGQSVELANAVRGHHALALGLSRSAADAYVHALVANPRSGESLLGLARLYARLGCEREALGLARVSVRALKASTRYPSQCRAAEALIETLRSSGAPELDVDFDAPLPDLLNLAEAALEAYDHALAHVVLRSVLVRNVATHKAWGRLGRLNGRRQFLEAAWQELQLALMNGLQDPLTGVLVSNLALEKGMPARARALQAMLESQFPDHPWTAYNRAELLSLTEDSQGAELAYQAAARRFPSDPAIAGSLITLRVRRGKHAEALAALEAFRGDPSTLAFEHAQALDHLSRHDDALTQFDRAIELRPLDTRAHTLRAHLLERLGRPEEALAGYQRSLALFPLQSSVRCELGLLLYALNRDGEAKTELNQAWNDAHSEELPRVACRISESLLESRQRTNLAAGWAQRACEADPQRTQARCLRGRIHALRGDVDAARADLSWVLERDTTDEHALAFFAQQAALEGDLDLADTRSQELLILHPDSLASHATRARVLLARGHTEQAWPHARRAANLKPTDPDMLFLAVMVGSSVGDWAAVREHAERLLALDPPPAKALADPAALRLERALRELEAE